MRTLLGTIALVGVVAGAAVVPAAGSHANTPETVMITYRPKTGAEVDLERVVSRHWETGRQLNLVRAEPHLTLKVRDDEQKPCLIDVFTWSDEDIPDNAPAAIQAIWAEMAQLTESRGGRPGIDIARATITGTIHQTLFPTARSLAPLNSTVMGHPNEQ